MVTTDTRPSIAELEAKRVGVSDPDDFVHDEATYRQFDIIGNDTSCWTDNSCDARAIVATMKAATALIAIAKAAQAFIDAHDRPDLIGDAWHIGCADARARLRMELGKVRP